MSICRVISCAVGRGSLLWPLCSPGKTLLAVALLHSVLRGQTYLLLQVSLEVLPLHSNPLWWKGHLFLVLVLEGLLFSSISLHWLLRKAFLSLLAILWNYSFRCLYLSFSPLLLTSLLFTAIFKASPDSHFAFLHFFSMEMVLIPVSCTMSRTSVHSSSGTLSDLVP